MPVVTLLFVGIIMSLTSAFVWMFRELECHAKAWRSQFAMSRISTRDRRGGPMRRRD